MLRHTDTRPCDAQAIDYTATSAKSGDRDKSENRKSASRYRFVTSAMDSRPRYPSRVSMRRHFSAEHLHQVRPLAHIIEFDIRRAVSDVPGNQAVGLCANADRISPIAQCRFTDAALGIGKQRGQVLAIPRAGSVLVSERTQIDQGRLEVQRLHESVTRTSRGMDPGDTDDQRRNPSKARKSLSLRKMRRRPRLSTGYTYPPNVIRSSLDMNSIVHDTHRPHT